MDHRTRTTTVTFKMPFIFAELGEMQPAGDYVIETREELVQGISFLAYQRVQTEIHLHPTPGVMQKLTIDPNKLAAALRRDKANSDLTPDHKALCGK